MTSPRPGLVKVRAIPLVGVRRLALVRLAPPRIDALMASADVISEGSEVAGERGRRVYFGSTSFVLVTSAAELASDEALAALVGDLHLRVLAMRRARAEAAARASGPVGTVRAELRVQRARGAIEIVVDLEVAVSRAARVRG